MSETVAVKVSSRYQIAVPQGARQRLHIQKGDRLLVDIQDGLMILTPQPTNFTAHLAGLHGDVWAGIDAATYLREERAAWDNSADG